MLNLLPPEEKIILKQEQNKRLLVVLAMEFLIFLTSILLVLLAVEFNILGEFVSQSFLLRQVQAEGQSSDSSRFEKEMMAYNKKLVVIDSFYKDRVFQGDALNTLLKVDRPSGLYFVKFSLQPQQPNRTKVIIAGVSDTRDNLLTFKNNVEAVKNIENINFSPESWISQKNVNFNLTLDILNGK
ncbi:MAG: hypothetical protein Q8Q48_00785 [Candidatus Staskawiczbacteria bacterium]|nr:hypothetical protein [Candidatus Staskawiczbacteria bacterium]